MITFINAAVYKCIQGLKAIAKFIHLSFRRQKDHNHVLSVDDRVYTK